MNYNQVLSDDCATGIGLRWLESTDSAYEASKIYDKNSLNTSVDQVFAFSRKYGITFQDAVAIYYATYRAPMETMSRVTSYQAAWFLLELSDKYYQKEKEGKYEKVGNVKG